MLDTDVGYVGGHKMDPTYQHVSRGNTGHAEAVRIAFDPRLVTLQELMGVFFDIHDPTTRNRQGNDIGTQYRSAIFYRDEVQKTAAQEAIAVEEARIRKAVVTTVEPLSVFYVAEDYHQDYLAKGGQAANKGNTEPIRCYG